MELIPSLPATWGALPLQADSLLRHRTPSFPSIVTVLLVLWMVWRGGTKAISGSQFFLMCILFYLMAFTLQRCFLQDFAVISMPWKVFGGVGI